MAFSFSPLLPRPVLGRKKARRVLLVVAHPVASSFVVAMSEVAREAMAKAGHDVRVVDLHAMGFDPVLGVDAWRGHMSPPETKSGLAEHIELLRWADSLVFAYPTWYGGQPAMLKGWFDRVWVEGVAYTLPTGANRIRPLLRNIRTVVVITSHGSKKFMNSVQGEPGKRVILRGLRTLCHPLCRTRWVAFYGIDRSTSAGRDAFAARVASLFGSG
jgi:NAD(P)H dehydrogenase (quinone)